MTSTIFKVVPREAWSAAQREGVFQGSTIDLADGYIHFSAPHQVRETVAKHFAGQIDLLLIGVDERLLPDVLRWEVSRGGELFPHLYGRLPLRAVVSVEELPWDETTQQHVFPERWHP